MKNFSIKRLLFLLALIAAFIAVNIFIKPNGWAIALMLLILITIYINYGIARRRERIANQGIPRIHKRVEALIVAREIINNKMVLQLEVYHPQKTFITGHVLDNVNDEMKARFKKDNTIFVYVDPKKPEALTIENTRSSTTNVARAQGGRWAIFVAILLTVGPILTPIIISLTDTSDRRFQDIEFVGSDPQRPIIAEVRFQDYKNIYIYIHDPLSGKKITTVKDKKSKDIGYSTNLYFIPLNDDFVILGTGNTPIFDQYDGMTFKKKSSIKQLEMQYDILNSGIANIDLRNSYVTKISKSQFLSLLTVNGDECFLSIPEGHLFYNAKQMEQYSKAKDSIIVAKTMSVFSLAPDPDNGRKKKLYKISCKYHKAIPELLYHAGIENLNVQYFNNQRSYYYKNLSKPQLLNNEYFLEARFEYMDADFVVLSCLQSMAENANELLIGINSSGKVLFRLNQNKYPNAEMMKEDNYKPRNYRNSKYYKYNNQLVILFDKYGALAIDLKDGAINWTLEI